MESTELKTILETHSWIRVERHADDPSASWEERYRELERHHKQETEFLIEYARRLATRVYDLEKGSEPPT